MMSNSKAQLLASMQNNAVTQDWGAISVFSRHRLNRLLEQQFVAGFDELSFLPPFTMQKIYLNDSQTEWMDLQSVVLSKPLLSFESASLDNSQATLTLGIMSGAVTIMSAPAGRPATLISSFKLAEGQGFTLVMKVNLAMVVGEVDDRGRVTLDLGGGVDFSCNLMEQLAAQNRIGEAFQRFVAMLPRHKRVFELGTLELRGYNPLTPTTFYIRTQAAPGAKIARAANYGDGAVLIFIALKGKPSPGFIPGEGSGFPYLIPDDQDSDGNDLYSAALLVAHDMLAHIEQVRLDLLNSLLFPGENIFVETSRHTPHDLIVFGNIDPMLTSITLDPLFKVIQAGSTQQFRVVQAGNALNAGDVTWSVRSINTNHSAGQILPSGLYTSVTPQQLGEETVRNVVTASYTDPASGNVRQASALLSVAFEGVNVSPQASVYPMGSGARPVELSAATLGGGDLHWSLVEPAVGSLAVTGSRATYTPPEVLPGGVRFAIQRIQAQDLTSGQTALSSVMLLAANQTLSITPPYVAAMNRSVAVQLNVDEYPPEILRWSVVSGEGTVSDTGMFTAPAAIVSPVSVVRCELISGGAVFASGYSIIQLSDFIGELSWANLVDFSLTAPNDQRRAFANGYQQIAVDVLIETDGESITEEERSTLTLVFEGGQELGYLTSTADGIEAGAPEEWAVSYRRNGLNADPGAFSRAAAPRHEVLNGRIIQRVYVHTRDTDPQKLHAQFIDQYSRPYNSNQDLNIVPYIIELIPVVVPAFNTTNYNAVPKRIAGGGANPPQQDDYDYFLTTTDYWPLEFTGSDGRPVAFIKVDFEDNQSTLQWESPRVNETMFSYTGYSFNDPADKNDKTVMHYDARLPLLMPAHALDHAVDTDNQAAEGQLLISLFRADDVKYVPGDDLSAARLMESALRLKMLDKNGNFHHISIAFPAMSVVDSRNKLLVSTL